MTNDTTTLNGALAELGETLADNLVTMGVTDADPSDGLTTLAGKILDIPVGPVVKNLTVTSNKDILSYYDSESATLTATYTENGSPVSGKTVTFKAYKNGTLVENIGSDTTDANGEASVSYSSKGAGDLYIQVECMSVTETYAIEDCLYWNDGSSVGSLEIGSNVSCTSNGTYITITTSKSGEKYVRLPVSLSNTDNWVYEVEIADTGTSQPLALNHDDASKWAGHSIQGNQWFCNSGTNDTYIQAYQVGDKLAILRENGVDTCILNDSITISNRSASHNSTFKVGFYTNNGRTQKVKNIKLKAL